MEVGICNNTTLFRSISGSGYRSAARRLTIDQEVVSLNPIDVRNYHLSCAGSSGLLNSFRKNEYRLSVAGVVFHIELVFTIPVYILR